VGKTWESLCFPEGLQFSFGLLVFHWFHDIPFGLCLSFWFMVLLWVCAIQLSLCNCYILSGVSIRVCGIPAKWCEMDKERRRWCGWLQHRVRVTSQQYRFELRNQLGLGPDQFKNLTCCLLAGQSRICNCQPAVSTACGLTHQFQPADLRFRLHNISLHSDATANRNIVTLVCQYLCWMHRPH